MIYIITYILNLFDLAVTTYWVSKYGIEIEGNPIGRWLYRTGAVYPVKILLIGALLALLWALTKIKPGYGWAGYVVLAAYVALAVYHVAVAVRVFISTRR